MRPCLQSIICGAFFLGSALAAFSAPSIRILGSGVEGENQTYVPPLPAVLGNHEKIITIIIDGTADAPAYLRADLVQMAGELAMPIVKDVHLQDGITFVNGSRQVLRAAIKIPGVRSRTQVLVRISLVPNGAQASPFHLMDIPFEVFPAGVTRDLADLLQPRPGGSAPVVVFGPGQKLRHFLTRLRVPFEDGGIDTPDRFDPNRFYFGELATDGQFQQAQDRSAGARMALFSPDESLPAGVYAERSNSGVLIHVTVPLLDDIDNDPRSQLAFIKMIHLLSAAPPSAN